MQTLRKVFAISVIFVTVLSLSMAAAPVKAAASAGDLIKMSGLSSVYYLAGDGKRYVFPNESTYFSWYSDFSGVMTIPQSELEGYPLGANVTVRPGTKLVKITTNPNVYAVEPGGNLRKITSEAQATTLFGANWAKRVIDVSDAFFTNYKIGADLPSGVYPIGSLLKSASAPDVVYYDGTNYRSIASESAFNANRFKWADLVVTTMAFTAGGSAIAAAESTLTDTSSGAGGTVYTGGSGVTVSLSGATPVAASVPQNGSRVPMAKVNFTASNDGAITVNSLTVKRIGLSTYSQVVKVWAEKDGKIVASKKSMNSNDESILTFSPGLIVSAGGTVTVDLLISLTGATGNIGLSVQNAAAVSAGGATVSGSFPVNGNLMAPIAYSVANLAITSTTTSAYAVKVGDEKAEIGKFTVEFNGTAKDVTLTSIMLKNNGTEDLAKASMNLYLEYNGEKVSESATVDGRFVTFYFPAAGFDLLKDDSSKVLYVKGDIIAKETSGTSGFTFILNKSTDLAAYEKATGFGVNVYNATTGSTAADNFAISTANISAGVVTVSKKATSPSDTTIIKGSDNSVLIANIRADEAITADGLVLTYGSAAANAATVDQFENVRVWLNGILLDSFDPSATSSGLLTQAIDSTLTLNKGDNTVEVKVKAKTNAAASSAFLAKLVGDGLFSGKNPEYASSNNAVTATDITGSATGGIFTVQGATMTTVRNDGYALNKVVVQGATDVSLGKFAVKATNDAVKVTSVAFGANASTTGVSASNMFDAKLFVDDVQVGNTVDFGSSGATFSSLNLTIAKDATKKFELKVSFDSSATGIFSSTMTINAQDSRGTAIANASGVNQASTQQFLLSTSGTLNVALGGDTPPAALLAAKADEQAIAQYKFTAVNDSAGLYEINFVNNASSTGVVATSAADSLISTLKLYNGSTLIDSVVPVSGAGKFTLDGRTGALVPANGSVTLTVKAVLNPISNDATATDKDLQFTLTTLKFKSSAGTLSDLQTENDKANSFRIRKTVPTVGLLALPTTVAAAGDQVIAKFTVTADLAGDVTLRKVVLTATSSGFTIGVMDNAVRVNGTAKAITSTFSGSAYTIDFGASTQEVITAGSSKTFEVLATITGAPANGSITSKIEEDASYATDGSGNFVWSDGASITSDTYSNGKRVPGLTTVTQSLTK
jgi:hypothetical protein